MVELLAVSRDEDLEYAEQYGITVTLSAGTNSTPVVRPKQVRKILVGVYTTDGQGRVETTTSSKAAIDADTAEWVEWPGGNVNTATTAELEGSYTALRLVRVSGTVKMEIRG